MTRISTNWTISRNFAIWTTNTLPKWVQTHIDRVKSQLWDISDQKKFIELLDHEISYMINQAKRVIKLYPPEKSLPIVLNFIWSIYGRYDFERKHNISLYWDIKEFYNGSLGTMLFRVLQKWDLQWIGWSCVHSHLFVFKLLKAIFWEDVTIWIYRDWSSAQHMEIFIDYKWYKYNFDFWDQRQNPVNRLSEDKSFNPKDYPQKSFFIDVESYLEYVSGFVPPILSIFYKHVRISIQVKLWQVIFRLKHKDTGEEFITQTVPVNYFDWLKDAKSMFEIFEYILQNMPSGYWEEKELLLNWIRNAKMITVDSFFQFLYTHSNSR